MIPESGSVFGAACGPRNRHSEAISVGGSWRTGCEARHFWSAPACFCACADGIRAAGADARAAAEGRRRRRLLPRSSRGAVPRGPARRSREQSLSVQDSGLRLQSRHHDRIRRQPARADRPRQHLSDERADHGRRLRPGRAGRPPLRRQDLSAEARPHPLRIQSAEPDRARLRRQFAGGARPQARRRRTSTRCRRRRCASCSPTASTCCARPMWSRCRPTTRSSAC